MAFSDIYELGCLVDLRINAWDGTCVLTAEDLGVAKDDIPENFRFGKKKIVPADSIAPVLSKVREARKVLERYGYGFPWGKGRFVLNRNLPLVSQKLDEIFQGFDTAVEKFLADYDTYTLQMRPQYTKAAVQAYYRDVALQTRKPSKTFMKEFFERLHSEYPSIEELRPRYIRSYSFSKMIPVDPSALGLEGGRGEEVLVQELRDHFEKIALEFYEPIAPAFQRLASHLREDRKKITPPMMLGAIYALDRYCDMQFHDDKKLVADLKEFRETALTRWTSSEIDSSLRTRLGLADRLDKMAEAFNDKESFVNDVQSFIKKL